MTGPDDHLRDLIEQVLFTSPGERVMRPDFGSGLLGLVFEPGGTELAATTQHLVQGALQRELGHLISVEAVGGRAGRGHALGRGHATSSCARRSASRRPFARRRAVRYVCCDERRLRGGRGGRRPQRDRVPRGLRLGGAVAGAPPAHALRPAASSRRPGLPRRNVDDHGRRADPTVGVEWVAPGDRASRRRGSGARRRARGPGHRPARPHRLARRLLALHAAPRRRRRAATSPPAGFDPLLTAVEFSFKVECPSDFDCAAGLRVPARAAGRAGDRLPREGLRVVPPLHARPAEPARPGLDRAHARPTSASRSSRRSRTSPTSCPTARTPSRPRRTSRPRRSRTSLRRHARLVDYVVHEGSNARAGCGSSSTARASALAARHAAADPRRGRPPSSSRADGREHRAALAAGARDVRDRRATPCSTTSTSGSTSGRGATPAAACREGATVGDARRRPPAARGRRRARPRGDRGPDDGHARPTRTPRSGPPCG